MIHTLQLSEELRMLYEGMTLPQLHAAILCADERSQQALWYLLNVRLHDVLKIKYQELCPAESQEESKTFEDYLSDFYLYLFEGMPCGKSDQVRYYYLTTVSDNTKLSSWVQRTFRYFLDHERRALSSLEKVLPEYVQEQKFQAKQESRIDMVRIAYSIAWLNQFETPVNRYIFFRGISHQVLEDYSRIADPDDREVSKILGITYGNYRTKSSRLCEKVRSLIKSISREEIGKLDANSLSLVDELCGNKIHLPDIIAGLLDRSESQLPEYETILSRRSSKQMPGHVDSILLSDSCMEASLPEPCFSPSMVFSTDESSFFESKLSSLREQLRREKNARRREETREKRVERASFVRRFADYIFS